MFKRITKKQKKNEEEEALGLDEDAKEILGLHDTDSDESDTDSSSGTDSDDAPASGSGPGGLNQLGKSILDEEYSENTSEDEGSDGSDDDDGDDSPPMSLQEAMKNPIYARSSKRNTHACIICPGKQLQQSEAVKSHTDSAVHKRRFKRFLDIAQSSENADLQSILAVISTPNPQMLEQEATSSKRGAKQKMKVEALQKRKREVQITEKIKAKMERDARDAENPPVPAASGTVSFTPTQSSLKKQVDPVPKKKKRKVENVTGSIDSAARPPKPVQPNKTDHFVTNSHAVPLSMSANCTEAVRPARASDNIAGRRQPRLAAVCSGLLRRKVRYYEVAVEKDKLDTHKSKGKGKKRNVAIVGNDRPRGEERSQIENEGPVLKVFD